MKHPGWIAVALLGVSFADRAHAQPTAGFPPAPAPGASPAVPEAPPPPPGPPEPPPPPPPAPPPPPSPPEPPVQQAPRPAPANRSRASFPGPTEPAPSGEAGSAEAPAPVMEVPPPPVAPYMPPLQPYQQVLIPYQRPANAWMPGEGEPERRPTYVYIRDPHGHRHDGLYFRIAWGVASASDSAQSDRELPTIRSLRFRPLPFKGDASGFAAATELALGWTLGYGLVLGLGVYTATVPSAEATVDDPRTGNYVYRVSQQALISPVVDFYFFPKVGFHAQAGVGLATYIAGVADPVDSGPRAQAHTATGVGFMGGVGYEWWVSRTWSVGLLARVVYGSTTGNDPRGVQWSHSTFVPAALVGATYH